MRIPVRHRVFAFGAAVAAMLALSLAAPATANAAAPARAAQVQATVVVPDVVGKNVGVAINDLLALGLGLGFRQTLDSVCLHNEFDVVRQRPAAGSVVAAGTVVTLTFVVYPPNCP